MSDGVGRRPTGSNNGAVRDWQWLTANDLGDVDRERSVVYVTFSPLEVHGPHLPFVADVFEAEALATRAFERLTERFPEMQVLRLPPLFIASDVLPHAGSLAFRPSTVIHVLTDLGRTLSRQGFRHLWVGNFHGGPRHFVAVEKGCAVVNRRYGMRSASVFSLLLNRLTRGSLTLGEVFGDIEGLSPELLQDDAHAGVIETSILLHLAGDRVASSWRTLPRRTLSGMLAGAGSRPIKHGGDDATLLDVVRWLLMSMKYYARETYQGSPGAGSAAIGAELLDRLVELAADGLGDLWTGRLTPEDAHTPLYKLRHLVLNETIHALVVRLLGLRPAV